MNFGTETTLILRSQIFELDLQIKEYGFNAGPLSNMSRFLQKTRALLRRKRRGFAQPFETVQVKN